MASAWRELSTLKIALRAFVLLVVALAVPARSWAQSQFDYVGRCANEKLPAEKRIEYCNYVLSLGSGPNSEIGVLVTLAGIDRDKHAYPEAIALLTRAVAHEAMGTSRTSESLPSPDVLAAAFEERAEMYALTGQPALALADTDAIFRLEPDRAMSYAARCRIRAVMKLDLDKAGADCSKALALDARNAGALEADGLLQFRLGNLAKAKADYDAALDINGRLPAALYMRGLIELRDADAADGNTDIADAKDRKPDIAARFAEIGIVP